MPFVISKRSFNSSRRRALKENLTPTRRNLSNFNRRSTCIASTQAYRFRPRSSRAFSRTILSRLIVFRFTHDVTPRRFTKSFFNWYWYLDRRSLIARMLSGSVEVLNKRGKALTVLDAMCFWPSFSAVIIIHCTMRMRFEIVSTFFVRFFFILTDATGRSTGGSVVFVVSKDCWGCC